jgi:hypothetical protein
MTQQEQYANSAFGGGSIWQQSIPNTNMLTQLLTMFVNMNKDVKGYFDTPIRFETGVSSPGAAYAKSFRTDAKGWNDAFAFNEDYRTATDNWSKRYAADQLSPDAANDVVSKYTETIVDAFSGTLKNAKIDGGAVEALKGFTAGHSIITDFLVGDLDNIVSSAFEGAQRRGDKDDSKAKKVIEAAIGISGNVKTLREINEQSWGYGAEESVKMANELLANGVDTKWSPDSFSDNISDLTHGVLGYMHALEGVFGDAAAAESEAKSLINSKEFKNLGSFKQQQEFINKKRAQILKTKKIATDLGLSDAAFADITTSFRDIATSGFGYSQMDIARGRDRDNAYITASSEKMMDVLIGSLSRLGPNTTAQDKSDTTAAITELFTAGAGSEIEKTIQQVEFARQNNEISEEHYNAVIAGLTSGDGKRAAEAARTASQIIYGDSKKIFEVNSNKGAMKTIAEGLTEDNAKKAAGHTLTALQNEGVQTASQSQHEAEMTKYRNAAEAAGYNTADLSKQSETARARAAKAYLTSLGFSAAEVEKSFEGASDDEIIRRAHEYVGTVGTSAQQLEFAEKLQSAERRVYDEVLRPASASQKLTLADGGEIRDIIKASNTSGENGNKYITSDGETSRTNVAVATNALMDAMEKQGILDSDVRTQARELIKGGNIAEAQKLVEEAFDRAAGGNAVTRKMVLEDAKLRAAGQMIVTSRDDKSDTTSEIYAKQKAADRLGVSVEALDRTVDLQAWAKAGESARSVDDNQVNAIIKEQEKIAKMTSVGKGAGGLLRTVFSDFAANGGKISDELSEGLTLAYTNLGNYDRAKITELTGIDNKEDLKKVFNSRESFEGWMKGKGKDSTLGARWAAIGGSGADEKNKEAFFTSVVGEMADITEAEGGGAGGTPIMTKSDYTGLKEALSGLKLNLGTNEATVQ